MDSIRQFFQKITIKRRTPFHDFSHALPGYGISSVWGMYRLLRKNSLFHHQQLVTKFEQDISKKFGSRYAIGVNSGTSALYTALKALGVGHGDEVITVSNTWMSTLTIIKELGATIKFVDIDPNTGLMDVGLLKPIITKKTKAILPVHMYGGMVDMGPLLAICANYNLSVVEDACQSIGSKYREQYAGTIGDIGCFSFHTTKLVGAPGDGGMLLTNSNSIMDTLRTLSLPDWDNILNSVQSRIPSRLSPLSIPILQAKLASLDRQISQRRSKFNHYLHGFRANSDVKMLVHHPDVSASYRNVIISVKNRDKTIYSLAQKGMPYELIYRSSSKLVSQLEKSNIFLPCTTQLINSHISLPIGKHISKRKIDLIVDVVNNAN